MTMKEGLRNSRHFVIHELREGVYAAIATDGGWAICNAGIVDLGDTTMIFDTFVNQHAAADLRSAAEHLTGKPVGIVMNSHHHSDHVKGNQAFQGARVIATGKTREVMARMRKRYDTEREVIRNAVQKELDEALARPDDPDSLLGEGYARGHLEGLPTLEYTLPTETFEDSITFHGTKRTVEAVTFGGGHTVSDSLVLLPEEGVAYLGDLLFIDYQPYLCDGDPEELLRILDKVEALGAKTLVPGHGPVGTPKDIPAIRDYVQGLEKVVSEFRASGGGFPEAAKRPIPAPFHGWKWRSFYQENLEFLFNRKPN